MVLFFSFLLLFGAIVAQTIDLSLIRESITITASVCLAFIMIDVGLDFSSQAKSIRQYGWDLAAASTAAIFPALLFTGYFIIATKSEWKPALLMGISAAPTSAGVLFTMLMAAGLKETWVFGKARVLAILDDLVTILLLAPLEMIMHGFKWTTVITLILVSGCIWASFRFKNRLRLPSQKGMLLCYAMLLNIGIVLLEHKANVHLEVLIPAFMLGCLIKHRPPEEQESSQELVGNIIKGLFMVLVGASFPKLSIGNIAVSTVIGQVLVLTILANLGKSFLMLCYKQEASLKERIALAVAMFPRGEVGAAVLLIALGYGFAGHEYALAFLSLMLNLLMTGIFIWVVMKLLKRRPLPQ